MGSCTLNFEKERMWEYGYLKQKCVNMGLEKDYVVYLRRLHLNDLGVFICLHPALTLLHCVLLVTTCQEPTIIYLDVIVYAISALTIILILLVNFHEELSRRNPWIPYVTSGLVAFIMAGVDVILYHYHISKNFWSLGAFYDTYVLFTIYLFLPLPFVKAPVLLGTCVSILYIIHLTVYLSFRYRRINVPLHKLNHIFTDCLHYICYNVLGAFYRLQTDIIVRSSFFDRHQYVKEDIGLRNARMQEKRLLHSIIPPQIAQHLQDDIRSRIHIAGSRRIYRSAMSERVMFIQVLSEVSILYADVVNYTHLTTKLSVKSLVTMLHDLYGRFDLAASRFNVQRIKFLGDCYYCVAGLASPDPDHAKCCIALGHCMITQIREVRSIWDMDIDMRIGVHSGGVLAGVIGATKLQYDIWGQDVKIANKLESTGLAGYIHISQRTLQMLDDQYEILPGTESARNDPFLLRCNIQTYLIAAVEHKDSNTVSSILPLSSAKAVSEKNAEFQEELRQEFQRMPVGAIYVTDMFTFGKKRSQESSPIAPFLMHFRDPRLEYKYIKQPDYMLKYSVLQFWWICLCLTYIQTIGNGGTLQYYILNIYVLISSTTLLFITWYKKICYMRFGSRRRFYDPFSCTIFKIADYFQENVIIRMLIYMYIISIYFIIVALLLVHCDLDSFHLQRIERVLYLYEPELTICFQPWALTHMIGLVIGMSFIFTCMPFIMKLSVVTVESVSYLIVMYFQFDYIFHHSTTTNPYYLSEYAHTYKLVVTVVSLLLMERQSEFNNKVNFHWRCALLKKQKDAHITNASITVLLNNILPGHVVDLYMTSLEKHELYYEEYKMVAVMFASLKDFDLDLSHLRVLNEIIVEFDKVLYNYRMERLVEKIKIVGCTYMAACGLDLSFSDRLRETNIIATTIIEEVSRAQQFFDDRRRSLEAAVSNQEVVYVLTTFALDLMRTLHMCNQSYKSMPIDRKLFNCNISIGISSGQLMAGVVGASQVHYDVWGNPVNMASRMDSTGLAGHIQVTEESAMILRKFGIECNYRGMTFVKGRGILPTYFVGIDKHFELIYTPQRQTRENEWSHARLMVKHPEFHTDDSDDSYDS